jgi:hypothetical protein
MHLTLGHSISDYNVIGPNTVLITGRSVKEPVAY